jgi:hypothetical protein
VFAAPT